MGRRLWPALEIVASRPGLDDWLAATLDDFSPAAIEDLVSPAPPPGGVWDPTSPAHPEPPPAPVHWRVFFNAAAHRDVALATLRAVPDLQVNSIEIEDDDWAARSQRDVRAIRAGSFVVAPPWDRPVIESAATTIVIEPARGFGTGHHPSTRLCLRALSQIELRGARVLDLGTGSGVLAMAAALKGARQVLAIDLDPDAIDSARHSAALNVLPISIDFRVADFRTEPLGESCDAVLANLTGAMLVSSAAAVTALVAPAGVLVMSGFDEDEREDVRRAYGPFQLRDTLTEEGWVGLVLSRS